MHCPEKDLRGRGIIMIFFMIPMYFSGGMIPGYLNVKSLGLLDTRAMILVNGLVSTYNLIVCRTYFQTAIPYELQEAAVIDGCDDFQISQRSFSRWQNPSRWLWHCTMVSDAGILTL